MQAAGDQAQFSRVLSPLAEAAAAARRPGDPVWVKRFLDVVSKAAVLLEWENLSENTNPKTRALWPPAAGGADGHAGVSRRTDTRVSAGGRTRVCQPADGHACVTRPLGPTAILQPPVLWGHYNRHTRADAPHTRCHLVDDAPHGHDFETLRHGFGRIGEKC